jgi:drug/metabolite transporter (DMT)-like permease
MSLLNCRWTEGFQASRLGGMNRRALLLFLGLGIAWGIPYLLIKVAVGEITPSQLVLSRTLLAAAILMPLALARGAVMPVLQRWRPVVAFTLVEIAIPWVTLGAAEQTLASSTTGLLISAVPIVGVLLAFLTGRHERLSPSAWLGLALGAAGVGALVGLDVSGSSMSAVGLLAVTVVGYAMGPAILSRFLSDLPGVGVMAVSLTLAAVIYVPVVLLDTGVPTQLPSGDVVASVVVLSAVCTAAAFLLLFALIGEVGPVRATTITYVNPAVAVIAGAIFLDEPVTVWTVAGFALVVVGSYLVNRRASPPDRAPGSRVSDSDPTVTSPTGGHSVSDELAPC